MSIAKPSLADAPIPGANYTSDTRNYPWHRPPDITSLDEALEYVLRDLTETDTGNKYISMIEAGLPVVSAVDFVVTTGISRGKWTPDFAILLAGPVARTLEIMAKSYEIDYDMGIEETPNYITAAQYKSQMESDTAPVEPDVEDEPVSEDVEGFMSPDSASGEEQDSMLGYGTDDGEMV